MTKTTMIVGHTRIITRSCRDPETVVSNFWSSGGVRSRPHAACAVGRQRRAAAAASAAAAAGAAVVAAGAALYPNW